MVCRSRQSLATSLLEVGAGLKGGAVLTVRHWLSACTSPSRRAIGWFLMILSLSLIVGCSGGSGGDSGDGNGGGSDNGGSGNGGGPGDSLEAQWSITPFTGGLRIEWHNLANFSQANNLQRISINITEQGSSGVQYSINITDFVDGIYNLTSLGTGMDLEEEEAYKFTSLVLEYSDHSTDIVTIDWQLPANESDHGDAGNGTVVGEDHDRDGWASVIDPDDDNDDIPDDNDNCRFASNMDQLDTDNDSLGDICDNDDDNDGLMDNHRTELLNTTAGVSCSLLVDCDGDSLLDNHRTEQLVNDNGTSCSLLENCDGDSLLDNHRTEQLMNDEGISCSLLADCDSDTVGDNADNCPATANSDQLDTDNDTTGDVCDGDKDGDSVANSDEVMGCELLTDCDSDGLGDNADNCPATANSDQLDTDNDDIGDVCDGDKDGDSVANGDEVMGCELSRDCDGDGTEDAMDIDVDGDGLIEIGTAADLDAVRYVLNGTGFKAAAGAQLNQAGCGDGGDITACSGYELIGNISLTDYIAANYAMVGWQPIAHDMDGSFITCQGDAFSGIFDGNGFEISGLWINRPRQDCIGLFGHTSGSIRNLGVMADRIMGDEYVGGLVGRIRSSASIVRSYAVNGIVNGSGGVVGGLVGDGESDSSIVESYAINGEVRGFSLSVGGLVGDSAGSIIRSYVVNGRVKAGSNHVGGLVGDGGSGSIIVQSYAISGEVRGSSWYVGGLVGDSTDASIIIQSYAISGLVNAKFQRVGGLVGDNRRTRIVQSYAVSGPVDGFSGVGGLVGFGGAAATDSYWATDTSGRTNDAATGSLGQPSSALRSPIGYDGIYASWDDGLMVDAINANATIWCDEDNNDVIEEDERRDDTHVDGDNRVWDFGTNNDYPAVRCTVDNPADQRAWWSLNSTGQPAINQDRLDAWLDGSLP